MNFLDVMMLCIQTWAIIIMLINGPPLLLAFIRSIRFENKLVEWHSFKYYILILSVMIIIINGLPKF